MEDKDILEKVKAGDTSAFRWLVERYEGKVAATVIGMLGPGPEAEDVGQEVFIRLYKSLGKFRGESALGTYITRIAINLSLNAIQKRKRRRWSPFSWLGAGGQQQERQWESPHAPGDGFDERELVQKALQYLQPDQRAVVVLRMLEGYSVKETAGMLGLPQGTVLSRQARGRENLKDILVNKLSYQHGG